MCHSRKAIFLCHNVRSIEIIKENASKIVTKADLSSVRISLSLQPSNLDLHLIFVEASRFGRRKKERLKWLAVLLLGFSLVQVNSFYHPLPKMFELAVVTLSQLNKLFVSALLI